MSPRKYNNDAALIFAKSGGGVTAQSLAVMLKESGIEIMSSLPLERLYAGKVHKATIRIESSFSRWLGGL